MAGAIRFAVSRWTAIPATSTMAHRDRQQRLGPPTSPLRSHQPLSRRTRLHNATQLCRVPRPTTASPTGWITGSKPLTRAGSSFHNPGLQNKVSGVPLHGLAVRPRLPHVVCFRPSHVRFRSYSTTIRRCEGRVTATYIICWASRRLVRSRLRMSGKSRKTEPNVPPCAVCTVSE
jgi:hypothetical protein